jgi:hypothetical protein
MYAVLLAFLLHTSSFGPFQVQQGPFDPPGDPFVQAPIDPRLQEPLRLLSEVRDRDGQAIGQQYALLVQALHLTLEVRPLREGLAGNYNIPSHTVTISDAAIGEDPKFVAAALAHEIKHGDDADYVRIGLLDANCLEIEARGFDAQAQIARAFWPGTLPTRTDFEREQANLVKLRDRGGLDAIRSWVAGQPGYKQECAD